jgi:hypothetical protein
MALETPDKVWRVEVTQRGPKVNYRMLRRGEIFQDHAAIGTIEHFLAKEGVSMADLVEAPAATPSSRVSR